jgi:ribosomal-protein-alanine N-acetyltransferase
MLQIIDMSEKDIEQVSALEQECFSMPWSRKSFEEVLKNPKAIYVVAKDEEIIGYCGAYVILGEADINQVAVAPAYRNMGVGKKMLEVLLAKLKQMGAKCVTLEVRESNHAAITLYEHMGFSKEGIRKNFYEKPVENAYIMWKR